MIAYLDTELWHRRQAFNFFKVYDNPFFNVCANFEVTALLRLVRSREGWSFSTACHFLSLKAANEVEPFRYRLRGDQVVVHDRIHGGSTVLRDDQSFTYYYFEFDEKFERFQVGARAAITRAVDDPLDHPAARDDLIHYSVLPWISFTSFSHARKWDRQDSIPKMVFGKYFSEGETVKIPLSVEVHHALMDGVHVGQYFEKLEGYFSDPQMALGIESA
jgi:chloramphenicol O-acetyltransferase type A